MKTLLEKTIQLKNKNFTFDPEVKTNALFSLASEKSLAYLRGLKLLIRLRKTKHIFLGSKVKFFNLSNIKYGNWVSIEDYVQIKSLGKRPITLGSNVRIGSHSKLVTSTSYNNIGSHITIGNNVGIGEFSYLGGGGGLDIGENTIVGQYFSCHPENHLYDEITSLIRKQGVSRKGITIGKNCWIGAKVTILDGVTVGNNCVIAAGSVVTKSIADNLVVGGVPAKVLKKRKQKVKHEVKTIHLKDYYSNYGGGKKYSTNEFLVCNAD
jgi:acetyltransferase-like isoleucine patch superfamily enzyme